MLAADALAIRKINQPLPQPGIAIMKGTDGFMQAYNGQAAVKPALQLIGDRR